MGHVKRLALLVIIASVAHADTYYEKTTIPPKIAAHSYPCNATGSTAAPTQCTSINATPVGSVTPAAGSFTSLTDTGITGSTQCLHVDTNGLVSGSGADCSSSSVSPANPSGTIGLTTVNGAASTYIRSDGAPALSQSIIPTWTGLHTFSSGITDTFLNQSASTVKSGSTLAGSQFGILQQITNSGSPTSIDNAYVNLFKITDNQDSSGSTDGGRSGGFYVDYTMGPSAVRGKEAFAVALNGATDGDAGVANRFYVGMTSYVFPAAQGGTNGSEKGAWLGGNTNIQLQTNTSRYVYALNGWETDVANADPTTKIVFGQLIDFLTNNTAAPSNGSIGLAIGAETTIASGNVGVDCGICFGSNAHFWPIATTGSVFSSWKNNNDRSTIGGNTGTVANILYYPSLTVTGYAIKTPGFSVDGSGNVIANTISGPGGAASPYILGQSGIPFILPSSGTMGNNGALSALSTALPATVANAYVFAIPGALGNATATSVTITGTAGQFACTCTNFAVGQYVTLSGTYGGTGSITGYADPTTYYVSATNGTGTFTLTTVGRNAIVTTAGTPTGITYKAGGGWYFAQGSSTTAFTVYNNMYTSGTPTIPASPTAFVTTGVGAYTQLLLGFLGPYFSLTGGSMGNNGALDTNIYWKYPNSAGTKTVTLQLAGTAITSASPTTSTTIGMMGHLFNVGSASVQSIWQQQINSAAAVSEGENTAGAVNTGSAQVVSIKFQLSAATDFIQLQSYSIEVRPN